MNTHTPISRKYRPKSIDEYLGGKVAEKVIGVIKTDSIPRITLLNCCAGLGKIGYAIDLLYRNSSEEFRRGVLPRIKSLNKTQLKLHK